VKRDCSVDNRQLKPPTIALVMYRRFRQLMTFSFNQHSAVAIHLLFTNTVTPIQLVLLIYCYRVSILQYIQGGPKK